MSLPATFGLTSGGAKRVEGFPVVTEQKVVWRDLDALGHVNNAVYATYLETSRGEYLDALADSGLDFKSLILAELTISYRSPAFLRETLLVGARVAEIRNSSFRMESQVEEKSTGRLVATSRSVIVHYDYRVNRAVPLPKEWREAVARLEGHTF
jgi:acyl-CoA thioester hydrolase